MKFKKSNKNKPYTIQTRNKCVKIILISLLVPIIIAFICSPFWVSLMALIDILVLVWAIKKPVKEIENEENNTSN